MIIVGVVLLVAAGVLALVGRSGRRRVQLLTGTATSSCQEVAALFGGVSQELGTESALVRTVELSGEAAPAEGGPLESPLGRAACVWYRSTIEEHYRVHEWTGTGENRRRTLVDKHRQLSDETSTSTFVLDDGTGTLVIDVAQAKVDHPVEAVDRMVTDDADGWRDRFKIEIGGITIGNSGEGTVGFRHQEWVLPVGQKVYVVGEARQEGGAVRVGKPRRGGDLLVSTRDEGTLVKSASRKAVVFFLGAGLAAIVGIVLIGAGL